DESFRTVRTGRRGVVQGRLAILSAASRQRLFAHGLHIICRHEETQDRDRFCLRSAFCAGRIQESTLRGAGEEKPKTASSLTATRERIWRNVNGLVWVAAVETEALGGAN